MVSNFILPSDINYPERRDLVANGQWQYLFVLLRSRVPEPDGTFTYRTAYMRVEQPISLQHAQFKWILEDEASLGYWQLLAQCGLGERPCIRICVYSTSSHTRGRCTWHQPAEALRLLGLGFEAQWMQPKPELRSVTPRPNTRSQSAAVAALIATWAGQDKEQQLPYYNVYMPEVPYQAPPLIELPILGAGSRYSMEAKALGDGGYATVKLLQLVEGPEGAAQQLAYKQLSRPGAEDALAREAQVLQLLHPTPTVIGYYGSHNGNLLLEYCSEGTLSDYCSKLLKQYEAEEAAADPAAAQARQARENQRMSKMRACFRGELTDLEQQQLQKYVPEGYSEASAVMFGVMMPAYRRMLAAGNLERALMLEVPLRGIMSDALACLAHLHSGTAIPGHPGAVVTHNDLKHQNLLVAAGGIVRLADWGTGQVTGGAATLAAELSGAASTAYAPPEKVLEKATPSTSPKGDTWSLLQAHLAMLVGLNPLYFLKESQLSALFDGPGAQARLEQRLDAHYAPMLPPAALAFFTWGLQVDPQRRPSAAEVLAHPYMQGG